MTKAFKKWKSFVNEAQQDKKFVKKFNISVLQKNTPMQPGANPREYHQQIAQQAELGPLFPNTVLAEIEALDDRYFPRENRKIYTKWLANVLLGMITKHYPGVEIPEGKTLREIHPSWKGYMEYIQSGEGLLYIVDFLNGARNIPQELWDSDWGTMKASAEDWHEELSHVEDTGEYTTKDVVWDFGNGYTIVTVPADDLETEGNKMGHCVGGYCRFVDRGNLIYSLRDANNEPHVTLSYERFRTTSSGRGGGGQFYEIKGKQNKPPVEKYAKMIKAWLTQQFPLEEYVDTEDYFSLLDDEEIEGLIGKEGFIESLQNNFHRFKNAGTSFWTKAVQKIADLKKAEDEKSTHASARSGAYSTGSFSEITALDGIIANIFYLLRNRGFENGMDILNPILETFNEEKLLVNDQILLQSLSPPARTLWPSAGTSDLRRGAFANLAEEEEKRLVEFYEKVYRKTKIQDRFNNKNLDTEKILDDEYVRGQISKHRDLLMSALANSNYTSPETVNDIWENLSVRGGLDPFNDFVNPPEERKKRVVRGVKKFEGANILRELLMNKNLSEKNIVGVLKNFIDPETGTLIYEPAIKAEPTADDYKSDVGGQNTGSRPIQAFSFRRYGHDAQDPLGKKAEVAYGLLSRNPGLSEKVVELLAKTAIQKDIENNRVVEGNPQAVGKYEYTWKSSASLDPPDIAKRYNNLNFAIKEYRMGGARWKEHLLKNPNISEETFYELIENSPPSFSKILVGNRSVRYPGVKPWGGSLKGESADKYRRKVAYRALKDFVTNSNKMSQALEKDEAVEPRSLSYDETMYAGGKKSTYTPESHKNEYKQTRIANDAIFRPKSDMGGLAESYYHRKKDAYTALANMSQDMSMPEQKKFSESIRKLAQQNKNWIPVTKDLAIYWIVEAKYDLVVIADRIDNKLKYDAPYYFDDEGNRSDDRIIELNKQLPEKHEEKLRSREEDEQRRAKQRVEWVRQEMSRRVENIE